MRVEGRLEVLVELLLDRLPVRARLDAQELLQHLVRPRIAARADIAGIAAGGGLRELEDRFFVFSTLVLVEELHEDPLCRSYCV